MLPKEKQTALRYIRRLRLLTNGSSKDAACLVEAVLHLWQKQGYPAIADRCSHSAKVFIGLPLVVEFSKWLADLDVLTGAFYLSSAYAAWVDKKTRDGMAMFFTPPVLSLRLIDNLIANGASLTKHVWLDPACGGAAFIAPVAKRMVAALRSKGMTASQILEHVAIHVIGNDIDPYLTRISKEFIRMVLVEEIKSAGFEPKFKLTTGNALTSLDKLAGTIDVVICNPPYRKMKQPEVNDYLEWYGVVITGQPNLYALFFKLALELLKPKGVAGLLTPTSYLSGNYFKPLRSHLIANASVNQIDIIDALGAFIDVDQQTVITVFKSKGFPVQATQVYASLKAANFTQLGSCALPMDGSAWSIPRDPADAAILKMAEYSNYRLADYGYKARVGAFVWNRDQRKTFAKPPRRKSNSLFPLVWSSDIGHDGSFMLGRNHIPGAEAAYVDLVNKSHMSVIRKPCLVLQRVTSADQPRRLIGAPIPAELLKKFGGVVGENHVVFLEQTSSTPVLTPTQLAKVLRSETIDRLFRCISGAVNVSIFELNHLALPDPVRLKSELSKNKSIDDAVKNAYQPPKHKP